MITYFETPVIFGPQQHLMGMLCQPAPSAPAPRFACILMNAGVVHRVGPHRLNVKMARALTQQNVPSLRFDLSGRGDSLPPPSTPKPIQDNLTPKGAGQDVSDLQEAMNHLQTTLGIARFVVIGICSGAVNAYKLAQADERVVGMVMFDGFVFPTRKTYWLRRYYRWRLMSWAEIGQKIVNKLRAKRRTGAAPQKAAPLPGSGSPPRAQFASVMLALQKRGVHTSLIYSGSFIELHNYHDQLADAFKNEPFLKDLHYEFMPDVDHTATPLAAQRKLINRICDWAQQNF